MIQGMGGLMSVTGLPDGAPGGGPQKVGIAVSDLMAGMYSLSAILGALYERERSGRGQWIDLALLDSQVAWLANQGLNFLTTGKAPGRHGTAHPNIVPYQAFETADGHLMLAVGNDRQFVKFCEAADCAEFARDARYLTNKLRVSNREPLIASLAPVLRRRTTRNWLKVLAGSGVPCGPINDIAAVFAEPQVKHRDMRIDLPHALTGTAPGIRNPVLFSRTPLEYRTAPPVLGQDTAQVLKSVLEMTESDLEALRASGVVR
jgi:crotonobetainyl-CoA:carnitine CoA-transferase CaiB-like acyl-CoA transferase